MFLRQRRPDGRRRPRGVSSESKRKSGALRPLERLEERTLLSVDLGLVKDINAVDNAPANITPVGSSLYFTTHDAHDNGTDLVVQTASGPTVLKDFNVPNTDGTFPGVTDLTAVGASLYFAANGGDGNELWTTDGKTVQEVKDLNPGKGSSNPGNLTALGSEVFFTADPAGGTTTELFMTDGTDKGTKPVIDPTSAAPFTQAADLTVFQGQLFFTESVPGKQELWQLAFDPSMGTATPSLVTSQLSIGQLTPSGSQLFYVADDGAVGQQIWTFALFGMPTRVTAVNPFGFNPLELTTAPGGVFFSALDGEPTHGRELWFSDGTTANSKMVADINAAGDSNPGNLTVAGSNLFFTASDGHGTSTSGLELWVTDGKSVTRLADVDPFNGPGEFAALGNVLYFANDAGASGVELWRSDGTAAGTKLAQDINPGAASSFPQDLTPVKNTLLFSAHDGSGGNQLWSLDGSSGAATKTASFLPGSTQGAFAPLPFSPPSFAQVGGSDLFFANDGTPGLQLWKTDGTAVGTTMVKSIALDAFVSSIVVPSLVTLTAAAGKVYFALPNDAGGSDLWVSDGTGAGTSKLTSFQTSPAGFTALGSTVLFSASDDLSKGELWKTDGTVAGTQKVLELPDNPANVPDTPTDLTAFNNQIYFAANTELWASDGTAGNTKKLASVAASDLTVFLGRLFFISGKDLWSSDGSSAGTALFKSFSTFTNPFVRQLTPSGQKLFFEADTGTATDPTSLWVSDGTPGGTNPVSNLQLNTSFTLASLNNGKVVFAANDGTHGNEPYVSDGTSGGTLLLDDINQGAGDSIPTFFTTPTALLGGTLYFGANDGIAGEELWQTDGTVAGTVQTQDINPGPLSSDPLPVGSLAGKLLVLADDGNHGVELMIDGGGSSTPQLATIADQSTAAGSALSVTVSASDPDPGAVLTYGLGTGAPAGASIDAKTGVFTWTPTAAQAGQTYSIPVTVSNNATPPKTAGETFKVTVTAANTNLSIGPVSPQTVAAGATLTLTVSASDTDKTQTLTFSLGAGAPTGASIDAKTGVFTWTPTAAQAGQTYTIPVAVQDSQAPPNKAAETFSVTVTAPVAGPVLNPITPQTAVAGNTIAVTVSASDTDKSQVLTFSLGSGAPSGASIDPKTGVFTWAPTVAQAGTYSIPVIVQDGNSPPLKATGTIALTVYSGPVLSPVSAQKVSAGKTLTVTVSASDTDKSQTLTYSLGAGAPAGASIDAKTGVLTWTPTAAQVGNATITVVAQDGDTPPNKASEPVAVEVDRALTAPDDYAGAGISQVAVFRPSTSQWLVGGIPSPIPFGAPNLFDIPAPGDYAGSGKTQVAVFRPSSSQWFIGGQADPITFGAPNLIDIPVPGDYDGVGHAEPAVFRPSTSQWFVLGPQGGHAISALGPNDAFGAPNLFDIPVPGDYDGTGVTEVAIFRPSTSQWFIAGHADPITFGAPNLFDIPVPGDYDGTGHTEIAVFRPSTSQWYVLGPQGGHAISALGPNDAFGAPNLFDVPAGGPVAALVKLGLVGPSISAASVSAMAVQAPAVPAADQVVYVPLVTSIPDGPTRRPSVDAHSLAIDSLLGGGD